MSSFKHSILIFHPNLCLQCQCSTILCEAQDVLGQAGTLSQALLPLTSFCPPGWRGGVSRIGCTSTYVHGRAPSPTVCASNDIWSLWSTTTAKIAVWFVDLLYVYWWDRLDHVGSKREDGFHKFWLVGQQAWCNWRAAWNLVACCGDKSICCLEPNPRGSMRWHKPQNCLSHSNRVCDILDSLCICLCSTQFHSRHCLISSCDFKPCSQHLA